MQYPQLLLQALRRRFWFVLPDTYIAVSLPPVESLQQLQIAARPSTQRLHLRSVFANGRRYFLNELDNGRFRMVTTNKMPFYRRRTSAATILYGEMHADNAAHTTIRLKARFKMMYFLDTFLLPTFMASLLIFMPWPVWVIIALTFALFALSWRGHLHHATLEAQEMLYFIHKALEEHLAPPPQVLIAHSADITLEHDFAAVWEKFYEEMTEDQPDPATANPFTE